MYLHCSNQQLQNAITLIMIIGRIELIDHFVNFIASVNFLHDVAYGTKESKLDSGEKITILNEIRTMVPSRIIKQYISCCQETEFNSASERTLYRIIDVCAASRQKLL